MSSSRLIRLGGLAAFGGGLGAFIGDVLGLAFDFEDPHILRSPAHTLVFLLLLISGVLISLGLVSLYASQSEAAGVLGLVGFLGAFLGTVMVLGLIWFQLFINPSLAARGLSEEELGSGGFLLSVLSLGIGWLLFGLATLRAGVYPRWAAILLIIGAVLNAIPFIPSSGIVFDVAIAWLGFILFTGRGRATPGQPSPRVS